MHKTLLTILFVCLAIWSFAQTYTSQIALLKYNGGGDWYANPTSLPNLAKFCNQEIGASIDPDYATVEPSSPDIFNYPFIHLTGHGNILFSNQEVINIRNYLLAGGFLYADDNYGLNPFIRREIKKIFPDAELQELPAQHPIFNQKYYFPKGLPKIHEHDAKPAQAFAIFVKGRMLLLYTYECDLGDGWENPEIHNDSPETRLKALRMGANLIQYVFNGQ
ncbi:MAG: hypothetical protein RIS47_1285 [Bacteroidota bacterium]|jgi:hypothetical protein